MPSNQRQIIEQVRFTYSPLGKTFEKQKEKQVDALKSMDLCNKKDELKQIEVIFPQNLMNDLICFKLKEILKLQDIIKKDDLNYKSKPGKINNFSEYSLPIVFLRDIHNRYLSLKGTDDELTNLAVEFKNLGKGTKTLEKSIF